MYQEVAARKWASTRSGLNFSGSRKKPTSVPSRMIVSVSPSMIARATSISSSTAPGGIRLNSPKSKKAIRPSSSSIELPG